MAQTKRARTEPPSCHPDRPHQAHGLCGQCYLREYHAARAEQRNAQRRKRPEDYAPNYRKPTHKPASVPACHPDRKYVGRGMCGSCYQREKRKGAFVVGMATCHPDRPALVRDQCHQCYANARYWNDPERYRAEQRESQRRLRDKDRTDMIAAYGGRCACSNCPETNPAFLCLDHVNGDGKAHRLKVGSHTYADLRRQGWPQDGYRLLCWNCNAATRFGRTCPHEEAST